MSLKLKNVELFVKAVSNARRFRSLVYDSRGRGKIKAKHGRACIGFGRDLENKGITEDEAVHLLLNDLAWVYPTIEKYFGREAFDSWSSYRQAAVCMMVYQMEQRFETEADDIISNIKRGDWRRAGILFTKRWVLTSSGQASTHKVRNTMLYFEKDDDENTPRD